MHTFATLMSFALIAIATANSGYNYQQARPVKQNFRPQAPIGGGGGGGIFLPQQAPPLASINIQTQPQQIKPNFIAQAPAPQYAAQQIEIPAPSPQYIQQQPQVNAPSQSFNQAGQHFAVQTPQYFAPAQQAAGYAPAFSVGSSGPAQQVQYNQQPQQQTIISKDIYIHSAPEETEEINTDIGGEAGPIRKNYRIVFIKAPSQNIKFNLQSLKRTQAANEEKTVIYVLSKKPDITNIQSQLSAIQTEPKAHKPEVYFIKYKTQEEANRAQQEIQAQYDALGGSTHISDEGIAPVTSVIGGGPINVGSASSILGSGSVSGPSFSGNSNFVQSASNNQQNFVQSAGGSQQQIVQSASNSQQNFVQQSSQGSQGSASSISFGIQAPSNKYLPAKKK